MSTAAVDSPLRRNPVFWIMILLPAATVVAGLTTLGIALREADPPLPAAYHWEGEHLDRDFARQRNAAAPDDVAALTLLFSSASDPGLDRVVLLKRVAAGEYRGACAPIPPGHWRVALEAGQWSIRTQVAGRVNRLTLRARDPAGDVAS